VICVTWVLCAIGPWVDQLWREKQASSATPFEVNASAEQVYLAPRRSATIWRKPWTRADVRL
jgi:hypothetical protein